MKISSCTGNIVEVIRFYQTEGTFVRIKPSCWIRLSHNSHEFVDASVYEPIYGLYLKDNGKFVAEGVRSKGPTGNRGPGPHSTGEPTSQYQEAPPSAP